ncbi:protein kinase domain-containing protein [Pengzhenrongella phosphoraccumulans]|uniref:protein kinase domain-containing protein n=1 Tax=Pengzhenrongella phosphoraccumulans TaxID=3114394 RepID=UPI00388F4A06
MTTLHVLGPVLAGGQAAVAQVHTLQPDGTPDDYAPLALRVEFADGNDPRVSGRRDAMLVAAYLSRTAPERYPALAEVDCSFQLRVPATSIPGGADWQGPGEITPLWCDLIEWGTPLKNWVDKAGDEGAFTARHAASLMLPVLVTVGRLWEDLRMVHRDLDEKNILVAQDGGVLKIIDWGIATTVAHVEAGTFTAFAGKDGLLPPELLSRSGPVGHFTDAWLLGRLLLRLITGAKSPYVDHAQFRFSPRIARDLPGPVAAVVTGLCDPEPTTRMSTAAAAELLDTWLTQPEPAPEPVISAAQDGVELTRKSRLEATFGPGGLLENDGLLKGSFLVAALLLATTLLANGTVAVVPGTDANLGPDAWVYSHVQSASDARDGADARVLAASTAKLHLSRLADLAASQTKTWDSLTSTEPASALGAMTAIESHWVDKGLVFDVKVSQITNNTATDQTFSWACARPAGEDLGDHQPAPGPYLAVRAAIPAGVRATMDAPTSWTSGAGDETTSMVPPACQVLGVGGSSTRLGTFWPTVAVAAHTTVDLPDGSNLLEFIVPPGTLNSGDRAKYAFDIDGVFLLSDDLTAVSLLPAPAAD